MSTEIKNGAIIAATKATMSTVLNSAEKAGFGGLRSGLGVMPGKYTFTTPNSENIFAIKALETKEQKKFALTLVAGTLAGAEDHNKDVKINYGLTEADKQMVLTVEQWTQIDPNQVYDVVVNDKSRIASIAVQSAEVLEVGG